MIRYVLVLALAFVLTSPAFANEKPSAWFCWMARGALAAAGSEVAAEQAARAKGVSEAMIAKAKRCPR